VPTVCSLIATTKLNDVEPFAYLRDILERMTDGHSISRIDDLKLLTTQRIALEITR
jgi:transposase